jgi:integrase
MAGVMVGENEADNEADNEAEHIMPKRTLGLTARQVKAIDKPGLYAMGGNLYLQVDGRSKSWIFRYQTAGRRRHMGLGSLALVPVAEARDLAVEHRKAVAAGNDPIEHRHTGHLAARTEAAKAMTFRAAAERYIAAHHAGWRNAKHAKQWPATLGAFVYPVFGDIPVRAIDVGLVLKAIEPLWATKPETASRVRGRVESVLDWATARGYRTGENPARWRGHLENLLPRRSKVRRVAHLPAMHYRDIGPFLTALRLQDDIAALALEFAILTATRTGEVLGCGWDEIDGAEKMWLIRGERTKSGREHRVPLSAAAMWIVSRMAEIRTGDLMFPGAKADRKRGNAALLVALARAGRSDLTVHGFRSCFRDWAAEMTAFPAEVCEMALGHTIGDKVEAAYRRGDMIEKRRLLAEAWATFCAAPAMDGEVVPMRRAT